MPIATVSHIKPWHDSKPHLWSRRSSVHTRTNSGITMPENLLQHETSPYLLQHKDNPVHWHPWGAEALETARSQDKPILLSVGYAACHWCHVMAHESFEDQATADVMNDLFVNIKVDREERPDIDKIYMNAIHHLGEQGGWPLTMFLNADGEPFWGGTYFPKTSQYGRPAFTSVLKEVSRLYHQEREKINTNRDALLTALNTVREPEDSFILSSHLMNDFAAKLVQAIDMRHGGLSGAPKFPQTMILGNLWRAWLRTGHTAYKSAVTNTLTVMSQGGIYDHLAGGFSRYSVDAHWLVPHFEKMLYDNALLIELMTMVWQDTKSPLMARRIEETVDWVLNEMLAPQGGFAASLDADSEGVEGKFYVWAEQELTKVLQGDTSLFRSTYDVTPNGNWEGNTILNRLNSLDLMSEQDEKILHRQRRELLKQRDKRIRPGWDDKVLIDWNGLMIAALAQAGNVFDKPHWIEAADNAFHFICESMSRGEQLYHSYRDGRCQHYATADGYANMIKAALVLHETKRKDHYLEKSLSWLAVLDHDYWDEERGGYYFTSARADSLITRTRSANDDAQPNANAIMITNLAHLWILTGQEAMKQRADRIITGFSADIAANLFAHVGILNGFQALAEPIQIVIIANNNDERTPSLLAELNRRCLPDRTITVINPDNSLPTNHPATGKPMIEDKPTLYLCRGQTCSLPVTDPNHLDQLFEQRQQD